MSVIIANMTMVDNKMSIMSLIYGPPSLAHLYADKTVHIQVRRVYLDSQSFSSRSFHTSLSYIVADRFLCLILSQNALFVGTSPNFNCSDTLPSTDFNIINSAEHRAPRPPMGTVQTP